MKQDYLELLLASGVVTFGAFKTKSGRISPYFFNTGHLDSAFRLGRAADCYAELIAERFPDVTNLFGPAYKGIPLAVLTAEALAKKLNRDISFTFNRKEVKDHGEGGSLVGHLYQGGEKVVVIEDVITGGTSFSETLPLLQSYGIKPVGLVVGVDRMEKGKGTKPAFVDIATQWDVRTAAILTLDDIISTLHGKTVLGKIWIDDGMKRQIDDYRAKYGVC
jgi:orotate phosphoribosyltransferase